MTEPVEPDAEPGVGEREPIRHEVASATHVGRVRDNNQDRSLVTGDLAAVADGMGGHVGGERAASIAIAELAGHRGLLDVDRLVEAAEAANRRVFEAASDPSLRGMGTTLVAAVVDDATAEVRVVNVGDSRAYRYRNGDLLQLTIDHSLVEDLVRTGRLTAEEAKTHPQRNIVTRVLGMDDHVDVDVFVVTAVPGDRFILASDGLFDELSGDEIVEILETHPEVHPASARLVAAAVESGGRDNVTVCLVDILDAEGNRPELAAVGAGASRPDPTGEATAEIAPVQAAELFGGPTAEASRAADPVASPSTEHAEATPGDAATVEERVVVDDRTATAEPESGLSIVRWVVAGVVALAVVFGFFGTRWYARSAWFATERDGVVVIMNGRPGGVLWWNPELVEITELSADELDDASHEQLASEREWTSLADAERFVDNLGQASAAAEAAENVGGG